MKNREEVARLISKEGRGYLPMPAEIVIKATTDYGPAYEASGAIRHPEWAAQRIDFQPWPYPSATRLIVEAMGKTVVEGDAGFLRGLDPDFVASDLVDDRFVRAALARYPEWPGAADGAALTREETLSL